MQRFFRSGPIVALALALAYPGATCRAGEAVLDADIPKERRVVGIAKVGLAWPQKLAVSVEALFARMPVEFDCTSICDFRGFVVEVAPGLAGGQISAGYAVMNGGTRKREHFLKKAFLGYAFKGTLMRTWGSSPLEPEDQTLLGFEGEFTIINIDLSLGVFRHVGSGDPDDDWILSGGFGMVF